MIQPVQPINEEKRLQAVRDLDILDTSPEESFDSITTIASQICNMPVALITVIDDKRNWFKSKVGSKISESSREISFCTHAILDPKNMLEIRDASTDERFRDNPLVNDQKEGVKYYAGVPLLDPEGFPLGTLCVLDFKKNALNRRQKKALKALGKQVEILYEYRKKNKALEDIRNSLDENNKVLREFASTVSHDLKMPLANMILTADVLKAKYSSKLDEEGINYLNYLKQSGLTLSDYINGLLDHYSSGNFHAEIQQEIFLNDLLEDIIDLLQINETCEINLPDNNLKIHGNSAALGQVFMNLISNSLKYNNREKIVIDIDCTENREYFNFSISDNGIGVPEEKQQTIFELFTTVADKDRQGRKGHGIGLSTVKKLVESLGGSITIVSQEGKGTRMEFSIKRSDLAD
ncbi:ATPase [Christiangramia fulva]|uniref:histidine kinase n=1 Tax=Christiangramia fulva TaxID=2126553 RepID=A0A2R3Z844_9FLAO|nr:GAF domain-containing sensor histidine kinase [Christiangramia fulva]AVR46450.1 ATPase [Christiangramia fulva]